jgi:hypothetical protein
MDENLTVTIGSEQKNFFMSAGLLNTLAKMMGTYDNPSALFVDPDMQERVILTVLNGRKADPDNDDLMNYNISIEASQEIIKWAGHHVLSFFTSGLSTAEEVSSKFESEMDRLMPSSAGSET